MTWKAQRSSSDHGGQSCSTLAGQTADGGRASVLRKQPHNGAHEGSELEEPLGPTQRNDGQRDTSLLVETSGNSKPISSIKMKGTH